MAIWVEENVMKCKNACELEEDRDDIHAQWGGLVFDGGVGDGVRL
jgi:hypothetical protein